MTIKVALISTTAMLLIASSIEVSLYATTTNSASGKSVGTPVTGVQISSLIGSPDVLGIAHGAGAYLTASPGTYIHKWVGKDGSPFAMCDRNPTGPSIDKQLRLEAIFNDKNTTSTFAILSRKVKNGSTNTITPTSLTTDQSLRSKVVEMSRRFTKP